MFELFTQVDGSLGGQFLDLWNEYEAGETQEAKFALVIDRIMPLSEAAAAHHLVAERSGLGKVLLVPED